MSAKGPNCKRSSSNCVGWPQFRVLRAIRRAARRRRRNWTSSGLGATDLALARCAASLPREASAMRAAEARKRLLDESVRMISEQGLADLSFREMARRAGVSHQAPYHHFTNREGILAAIAAEGFASLDARLVEARRGDRAPREVLKRIVHAYMTFAVDNPVYFRVMFRPELVPLADYPDVRAPAEGGFQRLVDAVADCHPRTPRDDKRFVEVVNALWAGAHGVATLLLDGPVRLNSPELSFDSFMETAAKLFSDAGAAESALD
jgi:AcrR family transcriptional regulator